MAKKYSAQTTLNYSSRKSRLIIDSIRKMNVAEAMTQLKFINKSKAINIYKLILNAVNNLNLSEEDYPNYFIQEIIAEEMPILYRVQPRARGSAFRIRKRRSRIKLILSSY